MPVFVDSRIANLVVGEALEGHSIGPLPSYSKIQRERKVGSHRIDFALTNHSQTYLEVKGCTMKTKSTIVFPDAPTERGRAHLRLLSQLQEKKIPTAILFLAMRSDVDSFRVNTGMDPEFSRLLLEAIKGGTHVLSYSTELVGANAVIGRKLRVLSM